MKNNFYLLLTGLLLNAATTFAQPTITAATAGNIGDVFGFDFINATGFDPGAAGENVTWDFTGITLDGTSNGYTFVTPASTGHDDLFPDANVAGDQGTGTYVYYKINASEWSLHGVYTGAYSLTYSDPETYLTFPLTYGSTFSDNLYCEYFSGIETIRDGSLTVEADAYGTLKLPGGVYENVLRVVLHELYSDEFVGLPYTSDYDFTHYYFLREGTKGPLFQYSYMVIGGLFPTTQEAASINANIGAVDIAQSPADAEINVFPNPAHDVVHMNLENTQAENIIITDLSGRTIEQIQNGDNTTILSVDVSNYATGVYMARISSPKGTYTQAFQVIR